MFVFVCVKYLDCFKEEFHPQKQNRKSYVHSSG